MRVPMLFKFERFNAFAKQGLSRSAPKSCLLWFHTNNHDNNRICMVCMTIDYVHFLFVITLICDLHIACFSVIKF